MKLNAALSSSFPQSPSKILWSPQTCINVKKLWIKCFYNELLCPSTVDANPKKKLQWPKGLFTQGQQPDCRYHLFAASILSGISVTLKRLIKIPRALRRGKKNQPRAISQNRKGHCHSHFILGSWKPDSIIKLHFQNKKFLPMPSENHTQSTGI